MEPIAAPAAADPADRTRALQWTHLAAVACLIRGSRVPAPNGDDTTEKGAAGFSLIDRLAGLGYGALLAACRQDQDFYDDDGLAAHADAAPASSRRVFHTAGRKSRFPLQLRRPPEGVSLTPRIGPARVLLPWPLEGSTLDFLTAYGKAGGPAVDQVSLGSSHETELWPLLEALDAAVAPYSSRRADFGRVRHNPSAAKQWLEDEARVPFPTSLTVSVEEGRRTTATEFSANAQGGLHVTLGWKAPPLTAGDYEALGIVQWPCGAFRGYGPHVWETDDADQSE